MIGPRVSGYVNAVLRRVATRDLAAWLDIVAPDPVDRPRTATWRPATATRGGSSPPTAPPWATGPTARPCEAGSAAAPAAAETTGGEVEANGEAASTGGAAVTELEAALAAGNARPRVTLATFPAGPPREEVMPPDADPGRWSPYAFTLPRATRRR